MYEWSSGYFGLAAVAWHATIRDNQSWYIDFIIIIIECAHVSGFSGYVLYMYILVWLVSYLKIQLSLKLVFASMFIVYNFILLLIVARNMHVSPHDGND